MLYCAAVLCLIISFSREPFRQPLYHDASTRTFSLRCRYADAAMPPCRRDILPRLLLMLAFIADAAAYV